MKLRSRKRRPPTTNAKRKPAPARNPLKLDPSRTLSIRRAFVTALRKRLMLIKGRILKLIVQEDALGLGAPRSMFAANAEGENCGIGPGGFEPGNTCAKGGGGGLADKINALPNVVGRGKDDAAPPFPVDLNAPYPGQWIEERPDGGGGFLVVKDVKVSPRVEHVPLAGLIAAQNFVERDKLRNIDPGKTGKPLIIRQGGKSWIYDGTHRATIAKLKGQSTILAFVYDLPPAANSFCHTGEGGGVDPTCSPGGGSGAVSSPARKLDTPDPKTGTYGRVSGAGTYSERFKAAGTEYWAIAHKQDDGVWSFNFAPTDDARGKLTGGAGHEAVKIMRTIGGILDRFVQDKKPDRFEFTAASREKSRVKLYDRAAKMIAERHGYDMKRSRGWLGPLSPTVTYSFTKRAGAPIGNAALVPFEDAWDLVGNASWRFNTSAEKVAAFRAWLRQQFADELLGANDEALWRRYVEEGFRKGAARAFDDTKKRGRALAITPEQQQQFAGGREQFLRAAFGQPVAVEKVKLLAGRTFTDLQGVTEQMATVMTRTLTDGLVQGQSPREIARNLNDDVDGIGINRATAIAQTEIIRAHAEGQLQALEDMGVEEVGVAVEWVVTDDEKLCDACADMQGVVLKVDESHGLIPAHVGCRCCFAPANVGEDDANQKDTKKQIDKAVKSAQETVGADWGPAQPISKDRPQSILNLDYSPELLAFSQWLADNSFCPTGEGGGIDPTCSPSGGGGASGKESPKGAAKGAAKKPAAKKPPTKKEVAAAKAAKEKADREKLAEEHAKIKAEKAESDAMHERIRIRLEESKAFLAKIAPVADNEPLRDLGTHGTATNAKMDRAVNENKDLSPEQAKTYKDAMRRVVGRIPEAAHQRIAQNLDGVHFARDQKQMSENTWNDMVKAMPQRSWLGRVLFGKHDAETMAIEKQIFVLQRANVAGTYNPTRRSMHLDGDLGGEMGMGKNAGVKDVRIAHTYAHELGHAIDGPNKELSGSAGWKAAHDHEIAPADGRSPLTHYAKTNHSEGFAEFSRLLYGGGIHHSEVEQKFPKASAYFKEHGLWPTS